MRLHPLSSRAGVRPHPTRAGHCRAAPLALFGLPPSAMLLDPKASPLKTREAGHGWSSTRLPLASGI